LKALSFLLHVDNPPTGEIASSISVIDGWFAWRGGTQRPRLKIDNANLEWVAVHRPDVAQTLSNCDSQGFRAVLDTSSLVEHAKQRVVLQLYLDERIVAQREMRVSEAALHEGNLAAACRRTKRQWLREHVVCPICPQDTGEIEFLSSQARCRRCGELYPDTGFVLDFLPAELRNSFRISDAEDISAHHYDEVATEIVEDVRRSGGKVLDCGSGMRPRVDDAVVCLEVAAFPSVDVLAVNQKLPFRSASFDAVLSLNVLEHVTDPFACASELVRVLKPGGKLYCCIPFLQPLHGYPHHYFNATRSGLRQLFPGDFEVLQHVVPRSGEPVWTLHWFLSWYAAHLPEDRRKAFLQLRVKDVLAKRPLALLNDPWVLALSEEGKWKLASTTAAVLRKPEAK